MTPPPPAPFRLGPWTVLPDRNELREASTVRRLEPMSMRLLCLLAENADRTTSRDEIVSRLWNDRIVTEDAVSKQVSKLRTALEADGAPRLVETVAKVGVRLTERPRPLAAETRAERVGWRWASALAAVIAGGLAIAVLARPDASAFVERPFTADAGLEADPALSPDAVWSAYAVRPAGAERFAVAVRRTAGGAVRRISAADADARAPAWSDDGRIAFVQRRGAVCAIMIGTPLGEVRRVAGCVAAEAGGIAWADAGRLIVSDRPGVGRSFRLAEIDLKSGARRLLTAPPQGSVGDLRPVVTADGGVYFLRAVTVGPAEVHGLDSRSGAVRRVTADGARIRGMTGAGDDLIVASDRLSGSAALWRLDPRRGRWRLLQPAAAAAISASQDGRAILALRDKSEAGLWRVGPDGEARAITSGSAIDWSPVLDRSGRRLAFLSNRSGSWEVWIAAADGRDPRRLSDFSGPAIQDPAWSPNGETIAVSVPRRGQFDIHLVNVVTGAARVVTRTGADERHPAFGAAGDRLFFSRRLGSSYWLVERVLATGRERVLPIDALRAAPTADGGFIFGRPFRSGLYRWREGTATKPASPWPDIIGLRNWTLSQGVLYAVAREGEGGGRLMRISPDGAMEVAVLPEMNRPSGVAVGAAGVIYSRRTRAESDLAILRADP